MNPMVNLHSLFPVSHHNCDNRLQQCFLALPFFGAKMSHSLHGHCRYFTANGTSTTSTLPLGLIQAAVAQAKANPYDTFAISISAGPSMPQGEVRPTFCQHTHCNIM